MKDDILTYREMCDAEDVQTLQRGMNFRLNPDYSVILMSQRSNAPYIDEILNDGMTIMYEGHDVPRTQDCPSPKTVDQLLETKTGKLTQNGKFVAAVKTYKAGQEAERVKVYEKLFSGIWSYRGVFQLVGFREVFENNRSVFRFELKLTIDQLTGCFPKLGERSRIIPTQIKKDVWIRDNGKCVICGATDELHFDHEIPYSKGGTSVVVDNVRILCARHNLEKSDRIE